MFGFTLDDKNFIEFYDHLYESNNGDATNTSLKILEKLKKDKVDAIFSYMRTVSEYKRLINDIDNDYCVNEMRLTKFEVLTLAEEIINTIDINYLNEYKRLKRSKKIKLSRKKIKNISKLYSEYIPKDEKIIISRRYNFNDVTDLVHEFMHHTNSYTEEHVTSNIYEEFISIYYEFYSMMYVIDHLYSKKDEIDTLWRLQISKEKLESAYEFIPLVLTNKYGKVSYENYLKLINEYNLFINQSDKAYNNMLRRYKGTIDLLEMQNDIDYISSLIHKNNTEKNIFKHLDKYVFVSNRYLVGLFLSFYFLNENKDYVLMFNKCINDNKYKKGREVYNMVNSILYNLYDYFPDIKDNINLFIDKYSNKKEKVLKKRF